MSERDNWILDLMANPITRWVLLLAGVGLVVWALAGCQTQPQRELQPSAPAVEVKVPVPVPCVDAESVDQLPATAMPPRTAGTDALAAGAAADLLRYRELARRQREILLACSKVK
jgi:hypothetical protein